MRTAGLQLRAPLAAHRGPRCKQRVGLQEALELAEGRSIDLLKVDTEGVEVEIITFAPIAVLSRIARVVVEYHDLVKRDQILRFMRNAGYQCCVLPSPGLEHHLGLIYASRTS